MSASQEIIFGVCHPRQRLDMIKAAGIDWVRSDVPFPWAGDEGEISDRYKQFCAAAAKWHQAGLKAMGITPYPRDWQVPAGEPGSSEFLDLYRRACEFLARNLRGTVDGWQICNELNLPDFRRPLTEEQAIAYAKAGGAGVRVGNPGALVGVNMAGFGASAMRMYEALYPNEAVDFDYIGTDGYFGSWEPGGPESWPEKLDRLHAIAGVPIIIQEFGYSSAGGLLTEEERASGADFHKAKKWGYAWGGGHTPGVQAEYVRQILPVFARHAQVKGAFFYCWSDHERCWQCGEPDCPCETAWGLVTVDEKPKPAYFAFKETVAQIRCD